MNQVARNSSFELLRLIAQYMIVAYHIFLFWFVLESDNPDKDFFQAMWIPLHIGVPLFVLISGYFGIRFSLKGLLRIVANLFVYGLCGYIAYQLLIGEHIAIKRFFFVSNTSYWFMRIYLLLYLLSPFVNKVIDSLTTTQRFLLLGVLGWMSMFMGLMGFEESLKVENVLNFVFIYLIGNTLHKYENTINKISLWKIILPYLLLTCLSVLVYWLNRGNQFIFNCIFMYNSPMLLACSVLFFIPFMRMNFHSKAVNYVASSALAIYLIHGSGLLFRTWIKDGAFWIQEFANNRGGQVLLVFALAALVVFVCIAIDKCLTPVWNMTNRLADYLNRTKLGVWVREYIK